MPFVITHKNRTLMVEVNGELDLVIAHQFRETVDQAMEEMMSQNLIVDLSKVNFIDSSGLGVILGRFRKIKTKGGQMILLGMNPNVKRILDLSGIISFMPICKTEAEAWNLIEKKSVREA